MMVFLRQFIDPSASRRKRWIGAILASVLMSFALRWVDDALTKRYVRTYGVALGRQVASQAEGLALAASQKGIPDPIGWAVFYLAQGVEPRLVQISRESGPISDQTSMNKKGEVEIRKALNLPGNAGPGGIRVTVAIPSTGFLGTTSEMTRDLMTFCVAGVLALLVGFWLQRRSDRIQQKLLSEKHTRMGELVPQLRGVLLSIGQQLRDIFRQFEVVSSASREAHDHVRHARAGFHDSIQSARKVLKHADEVSGCTMHAEAAVLNLMLEAGRIAEKSGTSPYPVHLLHQQILEIRSRSARLQKAARELERGLEPMTTDLDIGFEALSHAQDSLRAVPAEIQNTSIQMTEQAQIFQKIRQEFAG